MVSQATILAEPSDIILHEHIPADKILSEAEMALLRRELAGRLDVLPTPTKGVYTLQPRQYVGFVILPTSRVIEIRPKVHIDVLFAMLAKAHNLADFGPEPQAYTSVPELFEFVVGFFVNMVEDLITRGILRGFEPFQEDLLALRGKVLLTETIRNRPVVRDRHWCSYTEFTADVPENRILKLALSILLPFHYSRSPDLTTRLRRLFHAFAEVSLDPFVTEAFDLLVYHRLNEHYRPALCLARLLLSCIAPSGARGPHQFLAFLVDMNILFERYVAAAIEEGAASRRDLKVSDSKVNVLDLEGQVIVRPDVVIDLDGAPCLVLDAKYKLDDPNTDVYQALAYCHALGLPKALLVYPASEEVTPRRYRIKPDQNIEIVLLTLNLSGNIEDLRRQTNIFLEDVWANIGFL